MHVPSPRQPIFRICGMHHKSSFVGTLLVGVCLFFVLRTKPNPLARKDACRFAGLLFVQGVRIPRVQGTTRYCGSAEICVEISTDLETISSLLTRTQHCPVRFCVAYHRLGTFASICSQCGTSLHEKQWSTVFFSLSYKNPDRLDALGIFLLLPRHLYQAGHSPRCQMTKMRAIKAFVYN